jgi:hypothetical protein
MIIENIQYWLCSVLYRGHLATINDNFISLQLYVFSNHFNSHLFLVSHSGKEGAGAGAGCGVVSSDEVHSPLYKFLYKRPFRVFMSENWWLIEPEPFGPCVDIVDIVNPHPWAPAGFNVMTWNRSPEKVLDGLSVVLRAVTDFDHARDMFAVHRDLSVCMDIRIRTSVTVAAPSCRQEGVERVPHGNDVFFGRCKCHGGMTCPRFWRTRWTMISCPTRDPSVLGL